MEQGSEQHATEVETWPLPSPDVRRELEPPAVVWSASERDEPAGRLSRLTAFGR